MTTKRIMLPVAVLVLGAAACGAGGTPDAKSPTDATHTSSASAAAAPAPDPSDLSDLETKRQQAAITANFPKHKAQFKTLCGSDVDLEVDWTSFGHNKTALEYFFSNVGFESVINAFQAPCNDQTGKDAVKAKIKKIRAVNVADKTKDSATISGGTFTVQLDWTNGSPSLYGSDISALITKGL
jgi:hypothetical protein